MSKCCPNQDTFPTCDCCVSLSDLVDPKLFKALSDPTRLTIIGRLARCTRPATVSEIACCTPIDVSVVSRHLAQLREAGIVCNQRSGKEVRYALCCTSIARTLRTMADALEACCGADAAIEDEGVTKPRSKGASS